LFFAASGFEPVDNTARDASAGFRAVSGFEALYLFSPSPFTG